MIQDHKKRSLWTSWFFTLSCVSHTTLRFTRDLAFHTLPSVSLATLRFIHYLAFHTLPSVSHATLRFTHYQTFHTLPNVSYTTLRSNVRTLYNLKLYLLYYQEEYLNNFSTICTILYCFNPADPKNCRKLFPADGTHCGNKKVCTLQKKYPSLFVFFLHFC